MTKTRQVEPTTKPPHFATLLLMALAPDEVGRRIRQRRLELGWTHRKLADEMGVGERTVQRWQVGKDPSTGKSWLPRLGTLMDLADVMGVDRAYFIEDDRPESEIEAMSRVSAQVAELGERISAMEEQLGQVVGLREQIAELQPLLSELLRSGISDRARVR